MRKHKLALLAAVGIACVLSIVSAQEMEDMGGEMGMDMGGEKDATAAVSFEKQILPLLRESCFECHSDQKRKPKGNLRLDGRNWILVGGKHGPSVVPGDPKRSSLLARAALPDDHDDVMPPNGEVFSTEQLQLIERWIKSGARFDDWKGKGGIEAPKPKTPGAGEPKNDPFAAYRRLGDGLSAAPATAIGKAVEAGARVIPVYPGSPLLRVEFVSSAADVTDESVKTLGALRRHVAILGLRNAAITDKAMTEIAKLPNLVRLEIPNTGITDEGLKTLAKAKPQELSIVNLYGTAVTDRGLDLLNSPKLTKIYLWKTKVTPAGADMLGKRLPNCRVIYKRDLPAGEVRSADNARGKGKRKKKN